MVGAMTMIVLVAGTFAATNVDNLVLLVGWMLSGRVPRLQIFMGYAAGMALLLVVTTVLSFSSNLIPVQYLGYLGIIPILAGAKMLFDLWRNASVDEVDELQASGSNASVIAIASTQLANGIDTILVFSPLLADSTGAIDFLIVSCFIVMVGVWFGFARFLTFHASQLNWVTIAGRWITPMVMILVGIYILDNTATDLVAGY